MTAKEMPGVESTGRDGNDGGRLSLSVSESTPPRPGRQVDSPTVAHWRHATELADAEGDYEGFCLARRALLLAQAANYVQRMEGER